MTKFVNHFNFKVMISTVNHQKRHKARDIKLHFCFTLHSIFHRKTKTFKTFLTAVGVDCKALVITAENDQVVVKSARNIPGILVAFANLINVYDILNAKKLVVDKAALSKIEEVFA